MFLPVCALRIVVPGASRLVLLKLQLLRVSAALRTIMAALLLLLLLLLLPLLLYVHLIHQLILASGLS
jgi:hypothetical protein